MTQALHSDRDEPRTIIDTGAHHLTNLNHRRGLGFWASLYSGYAPAGATLNPTDLRTPWGSIHLAALGRSVPGAEGGAAAAALQSYRPIAPVGPAPRRRGR